MKFVSLLPLLVAAPARAQLPESPTVVHGQIEVTTSGANMTVKQDSPFGIVNWNSFSIGAGQGVHFANGTGATLNRVTGLTPSQIDGTLTATGSLFLLNKNGIIIGTDGRVLTGGSFIASTRDLADADFLKGGSFSLFGDSTAGVTNLGKISSLGGDVLLAGYTVENHGSIDAPAGRIGLAAGQHIDVLTDVSWMDGAYAVSLGERGNDVTNTGRLQSLVAELRTHNGNIYALAGNNDGLIQATGVQNEGGKVFLTADGGTVQSTGTIVATREDAAGHVNGGGIAISGATIENYGGTQDVSGATGGTIRLAGGTVTTDTEMLARGTSGAGGTIAIEADQDVLFTAAGTVDVSGRTAGGEVAVDGGTGVLAFSGKISADSSAGSGGRVSFWGERIALLGGEVDANGATGGGAITIGGGYQGGAVWKNGAISPLTDFANSHRTFVSETSVLHADATGASGHGGTVVAWSDGTTEFAGTITARGGRSGGDGGSVETSGVAGLGSSGKVDASAPGGGKKGNWLLDPKNITIGPTTDPLSEFQSVVSQFGGHAVDDLGYLQFGSFLDVNGTMAVVGSNNSSGSYPHAVYVFDSGQIMARLTSSTGSDYFGMGVGAGGDFVAVMDPRVAIDHLNSINQQYTTYGAVYLFQKGSGWHNGSVNQIARLYDSSSTDYFGEWGAPTNGVNNRFATTYTTDANNDHFFNIVVGNPTWDWFGTSNVGAVRYYNFWTGGSLPHGDVEMSAGLTADVVNSPSELRFGDYVTASKDYIYIGTGSTVGAQQYDLYVNNLASNLGTVRFANYFQSRGRPSTLVADGNQLFGVFNFQLAYDTFTWPAADNYLSSPSKNGMTNVAIDTAPIGGPLYPYGLGVSSVDVDGNELIVGYTVGGPGGGAIGIYEKPADSTWSWGPNGPYTPVFTYTFSPISSFQGGGASVAISGDYAIAGIPAYDSSSVTDRGLVAQFSRTNGTWAHTFDLRPSMAYEYTGFGDAVAASGNTFIIADPYYGELPGAGGYSGRLYVFENGALAATLANPTGLQSNLGWDVAMDGNQIAAIAPYSQSSSVILYSKGTGWKNGTANVTSTYGGGAAYYTSVDIAGGTVVAGAPYTNVNHSGAIDVFTLTNNNTTLGTPLRLRSSLLPSSPTADDNFGYRVATSGNSIAVLAVPGWGQSSGSDPTETDLILFDNLNNNWSTATQTLLSSTTILDPNKDGIKWGFSLAMRGDTLVTGYGTLTSNYPGGPDGRGVYVFERDGTWAASTTPVARLTGDGYGFGYAVDTDGTRIVVGAPAAAGRISNGSVTIPTTDPVYVFDRQGGWQSGSKNLIATLVRGNDAGSLPSFGYAVAISGDLVVAGNDGASYSPVTTAFFTGPFGYSDRATFANQLGGNLNISAVSLANSLSLGTDITLQANNDITVSSAITVNNPQGDGGNLTLLAGRRILVNASLFTDNGDLTLIAGDPRANATYRDAGEKVVVLGRDSNNAGVTLNTGTGDILIAAVDRFENRTGSTNPFRFDATAPGRFLVYSKTPDQTGAPQADNLTADLATVGRDWVYYNQSFDVANLLPSWLPAGDGFIYSVQPTVLASVGDATITYGQTAAATLSLAGLTLGGNPISGSVFGIGASDLPNLVTTGLANSVTFNSQGFADAGTYTGGLTATAKTSVTAGSVFGVAVSTGTPGNLTVNKATLDVTPADATRSYHSADPTFAAAYSGFVAGDDASVIDTAPTFATTATLTSSIGTYAITASGGADNNYVFHLTGPGTLTVTPSPLALTGLFGVDRTYNGLTNAWYAGTPAIAPFSGDDVKLSGTLTATATFADKNVGTNKAITFAGFGLTGAAAGNYSLVLPTDVTASVTPATLTLNNLQVLSRAYDTTTAAPLNGTPTVSPIAGDSVSIAGTPTAAFADKNVGQNKPVTLTGLSLAGTDAANYVLSTSGFTASINPVYAYLNGLTFYHRAYDGTAIATADGTPTVTVLAGDQVSVLGTLVATLPDKNVGTGKRITLSGLTLGGPDAGNYLLYTDGYAMDITPATLTVGGLVGDSRIYDGTATALLTGTPIAHVIGNDQVTVDTTYTATFADKNVGTGKSVSVTGLTLSGADAANYTVVAPTDVTASILERPITVTDLFINNKVYDGTTAATATGTPTFGGILTGDDATFHIAPSGPTFSFTDKNVGTGKSVVIGGVSLTGLDAPNYDPTRALGLLADITAASLRIVGASAGNRIYDATTQATVTGGTLDGVFGSDLVTLDTSAAAGAFADKNAGTAKSVTAFGYTISGADALNYTLVQPTGLTADITPFNLTILGLSGDKTYDGLTAAPLTATGFDAVFAGDTVTLDTSAVTATYADKNAGANKTISIAGTFQLSGTDAANYTVTQPTSLTGTIARLGITVSGLTIADKVYDGTTAGQISGTGTFGGAIAGDDLSINVGATTITFADKNVGTNKAIALSGVTLSGADAANYTAATPTGITASILAKDLTVTGLTALDKTYDRTATATLAGTGALVGLIDGDILALDESARAGRFADKNAGFAKSVAVSGLTLTGTDALNYRLVAPTLAASIARADATVIGLTAVNRIYNATTAAPLAGIATLDFGSLNTVLAGSEQVALAGTATGAFADKNVGTAKSVAVTGFTLTGADAANYNLLFPTKLTAAITPATLSLTGTAIAPKVYDATTAASFASLGSLAPLGTDSVQLGGAPTATFADKNAGTAKSVAVSGFALTGADAANYTLVAPTTLTGTITRADLTLTGVVADAKIYDGTTTASLSGSFNLAPLGRDSVSVAGTPSASFTDKNVGTAKTVTLAGLTLAGADAANYNFLVPTLAADVTPRAITVAGLTAVSRTYDGTTTATLSGTPTLQNTVAGDSITFNLGAVTATFANKNVGVNKLVTLAGNALGGLDLGNYRFSLPTNLTATITAKLLSILGVDAVDRTYDRTTTVALTGGSLGGTVTGDNVSLVTTSATGTMADKNVGTNKPVTATGYTLAGADAANYTVAQPTGVDVTISQKQLDVTGLEVADKFFDNTTSATVSGGTLSGTLSGDDVSLDTTAGQAAFKDAAVGQNKPVTLTGFTLGGADAANYQLPAPLTVTGNILQSLAVITDIIPAEVLKATANADLDRQRAALAALNAAQPDAIVYTDYSAAAAEASSGIPVPQVSATLLSLPAAQQDADTRAYLAAATAAQNASQTAQNAAQNYTDAVNAFKTLGTQINTVDREIKTETALRDTYVAAIGRAQAELAKADENLATIAEAKRRIATLTAQMDEANRLGRGSEAADYAKAIADAQTVVASEAALLAQRSALAQQVAATQNQLAASEAKVAQLGREKQELAAKMTESEAALKVAETQAAAAKADAVKASAALEVARKLGEASAVVAINQLDQKLADLQKSGPAGTIDQQVAAVYASAGGTDRASLGMVAASHPLSSERQAAVDTALANQKAALASYDNLASQAASLDSVVKNAPALIAVQAGAAQRSPALRDLDSSALGALDIHALGIKDTDVLPAKSPEVVALKSSSANLQSALAAVGSTLPGSGQLPANVDPASPFGLSSLDQPLAFDPVTEASLKSQMQAFGVLPTFTSPALAGLPIATQLKLNDALKSAAAAQKNGAADGNAIMTAEISAIIMDKITADLAAKTGLGDIPGVQAAVGAAVGELAAQYGIDPAAMTAAVLKDPKAALLGAPGEALNAVGSAAKKIVSNPVAAGLDLGTKTYEALKAGGEAFATAWGLNGPPADPQAAQRAFDAQKAKLASLGGAILGVETQREQLVVERDQSLQQAKDVMVATAKSTEVKNELGRLGTREDIQARTDATVQQVRADAVKAQVTDDVTKLSQQRDQQLAELQTQRAELAARREAFAKAGGQQ